MSRTSYHVTSHRIATTRMDGRMHQRHFRFFFLGETTTPKRMANNQAQEILLTVQAQIVSEARIVQVVKQLWHCSEHSDPRKNAQREIPTGHEASEIPCRPVFHEILAAKDETRVRQNGYNRNYRVVTHPFQHRDGIIFLLESEEARQERKKRDIWVEHNDERMPRRQKGVSRRLTADASDTNKEKCQY